MYLNAIETLSDDESEFDEIEMRVLHDYEHIAQLDFDQLNKWKPIIEPSFVWRP